MLVYKTTENNETKFYGVVSDEFVVDDLINDFDTADNAGMIDYEYSNSKRTNKLIDLTLDNLTTLRQAFEVYSIINNQSLKDTRKEFRDNMEEYGYDDKPETYYRVATLDDFKDIMFGSDDPGYYELNSLLDWLKRNVKGFEYTYLTGYSQGDACAFYKFNNSNDDDCYLPLDKETLNCVYGGAIDIVELIPDKEGKIIADWDNSEDIETVMGYYVDEHGYDNNKYVDEYMKEHYNAVPAEKEVTYY